MRVCERACVCACVRVRECLCACECVKACAIIISEIYFQVYCIKIIAVKRIEVPFYNHIKTGFLITTFKWNSNIRGSSIDPDLF